MSKISKLVGQPRDVKIGEETLKIYPLKVKDMEVFQKENPTKEEQAEMSKELIIRSLRDEDITKEDVDNLSVDTFLTLAEEINKFNGFTENERVGKIKEKIAQQQKQKQ